MNGTRRYRHKAGVSCGVTNRSVPCAEYEADVARLLKLMEVTPEALGLMTELAIQADLEHKPERGDKDPEREKQEAIALCHRRIEAIVTLYKEGRVDYDEYRETVDKNEREIAHWEARTTETEKIALELAMCMDVVNNMAAMWAMASPEDRQGMARNLFEYLVYDLDTRRITDFRLKPWADRFLILRASLYDLEKGEVREEKETPQALEGVHTEMPHSHATSFPKIRYAMVLAIRIAYYGLPRPTSPVSNGTPTKCERNAEIRRRHQNGEALPSLAETFGISEQRIAQIVRGQRK